MDANITNILNELPRITKSLTSLGEVEEGYKYSFDPENHTFNRDADSVVSWFGKGAISSWSQAAARTITWSTVSHETLAKNITKLRDDTRLLVSQISSLGSNTLLGFDTRKDLYNHIVYILGRVKLATVGISRLKKIYLNEREKRVKLSETEEKFEQLIVEIEGIGRRFFKSINQHEIRLRYQIEKEEGHSYLNNECRKRSLSDGTLRRRSMRRAAVVPFRPLLPDSLIESELVEIFHYLVENNKNLQNILDMQLKETPNHKSILLRKENTKLARSIQFFSYEKIYVLLKEKSRIQGAVKALRYCDRKVVLNFKKILSDKDAIQRADNEIKYLEKCKGIKEIAHLEDVSRYMSKDNTQLKQSLIIKNCDKGTLEHAVGKDDLTTIEQYQITLDILYGLKHLHDNEIVHLNLKPRVILLDTESRREKSKGKIAASIFGLEFAKPCDENGPYNKSLDIWMLGNVLYYFFFHEKTDWLDYMDVGNIRDAFVEVAIGKDHLFNKPSTASIDYLIWLMMHPDEDKRPKIDTLISEVEKLLAFEIKKCEISKSSEEIVQEYYG